jgi:hypothetical protein
MDEKRQSNTDTNAQRFMQADPYWACAGAVNVMLVFFFRFNAEQLRRLNLYYWIICYGVPAIPAIFSLIYKKDGKHMYGDATVSLSNCLCLQESKLSPFLESESTRLARFPLLAPRAFPTGH